MLNPRDNKILRRGLIPLGSGVALALCIMVPSQYYHNIQSEHVQTQRRAMLAAQSRLANAKESINLITQYLSRFQRYQTDGIIGEEHRLSWIEALRSWTVKRNLDAVQYAIDSRSVWPLSLLSPSGDMEVRRSTMQTSVNVLHEGDLLDFWEHLNQQAHGLYAVKECEFRRLVDAIDISSTQPTLSSRCLLHWLTVDTPSTPQGGV